jgi:hypothetical protein
VEPLDEPPVVPEPEPEPEPEPLPLRERAPFVVERSELPPVVAPLLMEPVPPLLPMPLEVSFAVPSVELALLRARPEPLEPLPDVPCGSNDEPLPSMPLELFVPLPVAPVLRLLEPLEPL